MLQLYCRGASLGSSGGLKVHIILVDIEQFYQLESIEFIYVAGNVAPYYGEELFVLQLTMAIEYCMKEVDSTAEP